MTEICVTTDESGASEILSRVTNLVRDDRTQQEVPLEVTKDTEHNCHRLFGCGSDRVQEICER